MRRDVLRAVTALSALVLPAVLTSNASAATKPPTKKAAAYIVPNMSGFTETSNSAFCYNGGPRPCHVLIRAKPTLTSQIINATSTSIGWPVERYEATPGDKVPVLCYVNNKHSGKQKSVGEDSPYEPVEGRLSPTYYWYEVIDPERQDPQAKAEVKAHPSDAKVVEYDGGKALLGYVSILDFFETKPQADVPRC